MLSGCTFRGEPAAAALCVAQHSSGDQIAAFGSQVANGGHVSLPRYTFLSCDGGFSLAIDDKAQKAVEDQLPGVLVQNSQFRSGAYGAILGDHGTPAQRVLMGELGLRLENFLAQREDALNCLGESRGVVDMLSDADVPFAVATLGSRVGIEDPALARMLGEEVARRATATSSLIHLQQCPAKNEATKDFRAYVTELALFTDGKHPWAPGCKMTSDEQGVGLSCSGHKG